MLPVKMKAGRSSLLEEDSTPHEYPRGQGKKPAHEPRVQGEPHADVGEQLLDASEMRAGFVVEICRHQRCSLDDFAQRWILAIEDPQRIAVETPQAVFIEQLAMP